MKQLRLGNSPNYEKKNVYLFKNFCVSLSTVKTVAVEVLAAFLVLLLLRRSCR
jgi:hypothetical protein